jgi:hypothetical protein
MGVAADIGFIAQNVYLFFVCKGLASVVRATIEQAGHATAHQPE